MPIKPAALYDWDMAKAAAAAAQAVSIYAGVPSAHKAMAINVPKVGFS